MRGGEQGKMEEMCLRTEREIEGEEEIEAASSGGETERTWTRLISERLGKTCVLN